jgi:hypothetical protein
MVRADVRNEVWKACLIDATAGITGIVEFVGRWLAAEGGEEDMEDVAVARSPQKPIVARVISIPGKDFGQ